MKSTTKTAVLTLLFAVFASTQIFGQAKPYENPKYGADSAMRMEVLKNISLYTEFYKQKNYNDAVGPWRFVFNNAPKASKNTYIKGAVIYKKLRVKDKANADKYVDTLMMIYDQRIANYGQEGLVNSYKANDLYTYRGEESSQEVYDLLTGVCKSEGKKTKGAVVSVYMQATVNLYRKQELSGDEVITAYTLSMETLEAAKEYNTARAAKGDKYSARAKKELTNIETSIGNVEALFSESGAATCEALVSIFTPQFDTNKGDVEWLKKVTKLLNKSDCTDDALFANASEQLYALEPSAEAAHNLARLFLKREVFEKSDKYYAEATKLQEDAETKALYYFEWSTLAMAQGTYPKVRKLSREALKYNPNDGRPYLMIGRAYASTKGIGKEKVENNSVYWVAVDKFYQAKKADPSIAEEADKLIATYSKYYPHFEEWFMAIGSNKGDAYTVGGWINENTTVRF